MGNQEKPETLITIYDNGKLGNDISSLYLNEKFSDVTLLLDDQKIYAHKVILASRSKHFENILFSNSQKCKLVSEIIIKDASIGAFEKLLKYVYTGTVVVASSNFALLMEVLELAHKYSFDDLEIAMTKEITSILQIQNVCYILNSANAYDIRDLKEACLTYMDTHAAQLVKTNCLKALTQKSMVSLLQRDSFFAPEIEIFKNVAKWCKLKKDNDKAVVDCVRFGWLTTEEIVTVVRPTRLVDNEMLMQALEEIINAKPKTSRCRAILVENENLATEAKAKVTQGKRTNYLLLPSAGAGNLSAYHVIDGDKNSITIEFNIQYVNHILMKLQDNDTRYYSYYIEISIDPRNWKRVINHQSYSCRSIQRLYFEQEIAKYIRIIGTENSSNDGNFQIRSIEAYFKRDIPKVISGVVSPTTNVATPEMNALVIAGQNPEVLINGDITSKASTFHTIGSGAIVLQLAQPYRISSMKLLLFDTDNRKYRYRIEISTNRKNWEIVVDRTKEDCKSWQQLNFEEKVVVYIRITGTHCTTNNSFHCIHFECPASTT